MTSIHWVGSYDPDFSRNRHLRSLFAVLDLDVREWAREILPSERHRILEASKLRILLRAFFAAIGTFVAIVARPAPDVYFASYPGYLDLPVVRLGAWIKRRPLVFDAFVSLHDTVVSDRELVASEGLVAKALRLADRLLLRLPDVVITDTPEHARFFADLSGRPREHFAVVRVGADEEVFRKRSLVDPVKGRVVFYGTYVPLQGVSTIVRAAALLQGAPIEFRLIGDGQERRAIERMVLAEGLGSVEFIDPMPLNDLNEEMQQAEVVLGIFGTSEKALRVVPHKVYEGCAAGRPVITADSPAIASAFRPGDLEVVPPGDPVSLAQKIVALVENPARAAALAGRGHERFSQCFTQSVLAGDLETALRRSARAG